MKPRENDASLTSREYQVLVGMSRGLTNCLIGREMFLSENTVKSHAARLFKKLGATDRAHAVALAFAAGLLNGAGDDSEVWRLHARLSEYARENERLKKALQSCTCPRPGKRGLTGVTTG
jgi:DNA-binding CsgD family transcriptional regulator